MRKKYVQPPPFCVKIELSEGCNLFCDFCGLQSIREEKVKNFKFMTVDTARKIAEKIKEAEWPSRIEFSMHGEPTMNPDFINIVKAIREVLPRQSLMMTSNGGGLLRPPGIVANLEALYAAGLNVYAFDAYESVKLHLKIMPEIEKFKKRSFTIHYYPDDMDVRPNERVKPNIRRFVRMKDISVAPKGSHSRIHNSGGVSGPPVFTDNVARCAKPFRELAVRHDGNVAICCDDWRGAYKIANILEEDIEELWQSPAFNAARQVLIRGERSEIEICSGCTDRSYRTSLLPDNKGTRNALPKPDAATRREIAKAQRGKSFTPPVKREWEKPMKFVKLSELNKEKAPS